MELLNNEYEKLINLAKKKSVVCFGIGKIFKEYRYFLHKNKIDKKIIALIDNHRAGQEEDIFDKKYVIQDIQGLRELKKKGMDFFVLVTTLRHTEIEEQIRKEPELKEIEVVTIAYAGYERKNFVATFSDIFSDMNNGIGDNGENMTISVLTHNRVELTEKLLDSIQNMMPAYKGKVLIGDNGSDKAELLRLKEILGQKKFSWELLEFDRHYAIPIGKNKIIGKCKTEWVMQLDNDIYFTDNPIAKINEDIKLLGCHVWGLPYYDVKAARIANYGSNLGYMYDNFETKTVVCRLDMSFDRKEKMWKPLICTYSSGAAALFKRDFWDNVGTYDEKLYVLEDVEWMYRVNMLGYKVGNIGMQCLIHDHKKIDSEAGKQYEAVRYSKERIMQSKEYLRRKYGLNF